MRIARLIALIAMTAFLALPSIAIHFIPARRIRLRSQSRLRRFWARFVLRVLRIRTRQIGTTPQHTVLYASNHTGYLDIFVLMSATSAVFLSKADVVWWPLVGQLALLDGTVFVDRTNRLGVRRVIARIRRRLESGTSVVFFPEGTSSDATGLLPFKTPIFEAARSDSGENFPIQPVVLSYKTVRGKPIDDTNRSQVFWFGQMGFIPHFWHLLSAPEIGVDIRFLPPRPLQGERATFVQELRTEMLDCLRTR